MYAIDIIINSGQYKTKQQIFENFEQIAWDLEADLKKIVLKAGRFIGENWIDFFCDSLATNKKKLQKMKNKNTKKFWSEETTTKESLQIILGMLKSEIENAMDASRGGKPLINVIQLYNATQFEEIKSGNDLAINNAEIEIDLERLDKEILKNGLKKMAQNMIFETDAENLREDIEDLCKKYGFDFKEIVPEEKEKFCQMLENGEIAKDECNQMYFDF